MNNSILRVIIATSTILLTACGSGGLSPSLKILPQDCSLAVSEQIGLTLSGAIDANSQVTWEATLGSIVNNAQGVSATYIAPSVAGEAIIKATVTSGVNADSVVLEVLCKILDPNATRAPQTIQTPMPVLPPASQNPTIVISEVMGNNCGGVDQRKYNQYIELYNYGDQPVDVGGWRLYDEGATGTPDELTSWMKRSGSLLNSQSIMDSTVIPAKGVAIILSPQYHQNPMGTSYLLPAGVTILTVTDSVTLGDDYFGIIADQNGYDTVTLYIGGSSVINQVVDTYGTPAINTSYPSDIEDNRRDNIPRYLSECTSIERVNPFLPDSEENWVPVQNGSPGEVPYH